jgi:hypothetical protein
MCRRRSEPGASERVDGAEGASAAKLPRGFGVEDIGISHEDRRMFELKPFFNEAAGRTLSHPTECAMLAPLRGDV